MIIDKRQGVSEKINTITILRIIATFMVVMVHFGQSLPLPAVLHKFVMYGSEGVTIFFIISGYLIAASLNLNNHPVLFYKKRIVRIIPVYFGVVFVNFIAQILFCRYPSDTTHLGWLRYFLMIHAIVPTNDYFYWNNAAALWTMSAFMVFYLFAPIIHHFICGKNSQGSNKADRRVILIMLGSVLISFISSYIYSCLRGDFEASGAFLSAHSPFAVLFEFLVGMFIYYCCAKKNRVIWIVFIGIFGSIFGGDRFIVTALFGTLIYSVVDLKVKCGEKAEKILSKLNEYSFSIYLGHTTVMFIMSRFQERLGFSNVKLAIFDLIGCILFIPFLHELIEKPGAKAAKKILKMNK